MCLCDLGLELHTTSKAGCIPGVFMLFLLHPLGWYEELRGSSILNLEGQEK